MQDTQPVHRLTKEDVARLLADPSPQTRAETSAKIALQFDDRRLTEAERKIAEDISGCWCATSRCGCARRSRRT
jgi:hypothetical protein